MMALLGACSAEVSGRIVGGSDGGPGGEDGMAPVEDGSLSSSDARAGGGDAGLLPSDDGGVEADASGGDAGACAAELCGNGVDDDCDGVIENGCACAPDDVAVCFRGLPVTRGVGVCRDGAMLCTSSFEFGTWGACEGDVLPAEEVCDAAGLDEDCDGAANEGCECIEGSMPGSCGLDVGACAAGTQACVDGMLGECIGAIGPSAETCDGVDEDCDGMIDEGLTMRCGSDVGACMLGTSTCAAGAWGACEGAIDPRAETCNGVDDDCDGVVDDGLVRACGSDVGVCAAGTETCSAGSWGACTGAVGPGTETCNNLDDDCDGTIDDGLVRSCGTDVGACVAGTETCAAGAWGSCAGSVGPRAETCNGVDDDCDGVVDDGLVRACGSDVGVCAAGTETCTAGSWGACTGAVGPGTETCNNLDDDCDGVTDDGLVRSCGTDVGACVAGRETCGSGRWGACTGAIGPVAETCNGIDDDCDGVVDEGLVRSCGTDVGVCTTGTQTCSAGAWGVCAGSIGPTPEACNGFDDDCDGTTDDGVCRTFSAALEGRNKLDILFVIDDSGTMSEEQAALTSHYATFMRELESMPGGLPDIHIGVVSSDLGAGTYSVPGCTTSDDGALQNAPRITGCSAPSGRYLSSTINADGTRTNNFTGTLSDAFACIARLGTTGCGFEQHMESMRRALDGTQPLNAGFLRPDAFLAVVFIADEDDCSASNTAIFDPSSTTVGPLSSFRCTEYGVECDGRTISRSPASYTTCQPRTASPYIHHPERYAAFLRSLKSDPNDVVVAAIVGNATPFAVQLDARGNPELAPSCASASGNAYPGVRFRWLLDQFPGRSAYTSICNGDMSGALAIVGNTIASAMSTTCLPYRPLDADLMTMGLQADCTAADVAGYGTATERIVQPIQACPGDPTLPCFEVIDGSPECPAAPGVEARLYRRGTLPPAGTVPVVYCRAP